MKTFREGELEFAVLELGKAMPGCSARRVLD